ncbi:hypothetical protein Dimus_038967 [Dionaea muscipula]
MGGESVWAWRPKQDISPLMKKIGGIRDEIVKSAGSVNPSHLLDAWQINGKFHTSKAYDFFRQKRDRVWWSRLVWAPVMTPRISYFLWLALLGRIQTKDRWKGDAVERTCPLCSIHHESLHHIFFSCEKHSLVWHKLCCWLGVSLPMELTPSARRLCTEFTGKGERGAMVFACFGATVYHLWRNRNLCLHGGASMDTDTLIRVIQRNVFEMLYSKFPSLVPV